MVVLDRRVNDAEVGAAEGLAHRAMYCLVDLALA
jgi:hypothetical protein